MKQSAASPVVYGRMDVVLCCTVFLSLIYAGFGLSMMLMAPKVPYADVWRFLAHFLQVDFPQNVLTPDNGHDELLPNLVRVLELGAFGGGQWLQIGCGIALLGSTLAVAGGSIKLLGQRQLRASAWLVMLLGLCWLGNERVLGHANEAVHAYAVTLFLVCGITVLSRQTVQITDLLIAGICGLGAAFSFGSGIAVFAAFLVVILLRRGPWQAYCVLTAIAVLTLLLLRWMGGSVESMPGLQFARVEDLLRWLAGPLIYACWPMLDPGIAAHLPGGLREPVMGMAGLYQRMEGPVMLARWPHVLIGMCALAWWLVMAVRTWLRPARPALLGIGISVFALAVGALIVVVRHEYFLVYPEQLFATRYVVWSSLFWCGLLLATVAQVARGQCIAIAVCSIGVLLLPSQVWLWQLGGGMRQVAERTALAATVGVVDPDLSLGENVPSEIQRAVPLLRAAHAEMFKWPEAGRLGTLWVPQAGTAVHAGGLDVHVVNNAIGPPARRIIFSAVSDRHLLLLVDADGVVRGLAARDFTTGGHSWMGWMEGDPGQEKPAVVALSQ